MLYSAQQAGDMTAPTTRATPKKALDQRATSRHDTAMRGAPELRALDLADTEGNAQILAPAIGTLLTRAPTEDVETLALVVIEGVWSALQLGCELPPEKRPRVRAVLKEFVAAALAGLMELSRVAPLRSRALHAVVVGFDSLGTPTIGLFPA
jgi:hypothetical protein